MFTSFDSVIDDIFNRGIEQRFDSVEAEREAIRDAKAGGEAGTIALLLGYAPALRQGVGQYRHAGGVWQTGPYVSHAAEDLRMAAVEGLLEAIYAFDLDKSEHTRLAATVSGYISDSLSTFLVAPIGFTVPARTLKRFYSILRKAGGNEYEAAALAPKYEMKTETFLAVLSAVRNVDSYDVDSTDDDGQGLNRADAAQPIWDNSAADAEDAELVALAFSAVNDVEEEVCRLAYGFTEYNPVPDAEIGERLGLSRQKTQRTRSGALVKMREALAVE